MFSDLSKGLYLASSSSKKKMRSKEWEISRSSLSKVKKILHITSVENTPAKIFVCILK